MAKPYFDKHKKYWLRGAALLLTAALLSACAGTRVPGDAASVPAPESSSRYELENDSPALEPFDPARVKPVVPVAETRTIAGNMSPYTVNGVTYRVMPSEEGYSATGMASWYGRKFHGHLTSNGEVYDMFQLSAAHRSLPIPSYVNVTNLENGRSIVVRVNDRGPFHDERIIDLSYAAAAMLGYAEQGTARVRVEAIVPGRQATVFAASGAGAAPARAPAAAAGAQEYLQVGAFANLETARGLLARLAQLTSLPAFIRSEQDGGNLLHRVRLGPLNETIDLDGLIEAIVDADLGRPFKVTQ